MQAHTKDERNGCIMKDRITSKEEATTKIGFLSSIAIVGGEASTKAIGGIHGCAPSLYSIELLGANNTSQVIAHNEGR